MAVTLRDVAEHAGVSVRTVSNVVNDFQHVSPQMRAKVQAAVEELQYEPNLLARSLRQGRTDLITLLVPEIAVQYFGELAHQIVKRASQLGVTVLIDETGGEAGRELELIEVASRSRWVDGVLLSSIGLTGPALAELRAHVPIVLLGERTANEVHDHVGIDNVGASREAVEHLLGAGRRRVAAIGGFGHPHDDVTSRLRLEGYHDALRRAGVPSQPQLYARTPDYSRRSGAAATRELLAGSERPDALLCFSDELAAGSLRELHDHGLRVPADVAVIGFDDVDASTFTTPSLSSVAPDKPKIAESALEMLLERRRGSRAVPQDVRVPHRLVIRESSRIS